MPYSVKANKVTTLDLDMHDLRSLLAEKAETLLGQVENGFHRKIELEPQFAADHGKTVLTGIRVIITDTLGNNVERIHSLNPSVRNPPL